MDRVGEELDPALLRCETTGTPNRSTHHDAAVRSRCEICLEPPVPVISLMTMHPIEDRPNPGMSGVERGSLQPQTSMRNAMLSNPTKQRRPWNQMDKINVWQQVCAYVCAH